MTTDTDTSASSANRPRALSVHHQSVFVTTEHEDEDQDEPEDTETETVDEAGLLTLDDEPFETTLSHHGVDVDTRDRASRIETGGSDEFVDDRPLSAIRAQNGEKTVPEDAPGLQGTLFADTAVDQRTLGGDKANARFMFEADQRRQQADSREQDASREASR
ncbi:hypothetical protein [Halorarius halobius]|uniref:hypothetical protein n=1 Tax=Halorarius halobius TaxID=2962671 RepID=UPI0020CFD3D7|nr:hypothetical protein [Halorarius halobius]